MPKNPRGRHSPADRFGGAAVGDCNGNVFSRGCHCMHTYGALGRFRYIGSVAGNREDSRSGDQGRLHRGTYLGSFGRLISLMATLSRSAIE
jgi:hypothetical protein